MEFLGTIEAVEIELELVVVFLISVTFIRRALMAEGSSLGAATAAGVLR